MVDKNMYNLNAALMSAAREGNAESVKALISFGADVHTTGDTPIQFASYYGYTDIVKALIEAGADAEVNDSAPLSQAVENGHTETADVIREAIHNITKLQREFSMAAGINMTTRQIKTVLQIARSPTGIEVPSL